eukprot:CAMPEP_0203695388 /NCGR_PEP_ID=MMETSP0091-20130426/6859_1 /ASSEMBLY_ACC=CAM_ASM_001089 /TAXON_ID=426623 /ORGANISM="Chaetoceros affinis, Strain CCMP159" /LENGTH=321 /DNA_ID=CAMNT_0050566933 /DNA_START=21 /DNA_END=986 /DNA_ORIENTATION=-
MGGDFGECTEVVLKPGDVLYMPMGTIHYAVAVSSQERIFPQEYSLHLTLSLDRQSFTWGRFLEDLLSTKTQAYVAEISKITASSKQLQQSVPINYLQSIAHSLNNRDIPSKIFAQMYVDLNKVIKSEFPLQSPKLEGKEKRMQSTLYSLVRLESPFENRSFDETVELYRQKLVMGTLLPIKSCPGAIGLQEKAGYGSNSEDVIVMFRRIPNQRMILAKYAGQLILATGSHGNDGDGEHYLPLEWMKGVEYALGATTGVAGQYFSIQNLQQESNMDLNASIAMIQKLLNACVLEATVTKMDATSTQIVEEENSEIIITPQLL